MLTTADAFVARTQDLLRVLPDPDDLDALSRAEVVDVLTMIERLSAALEAVVDHLAASHTPMLRIVS
jgi:hypothetical protein